MNQSKIESFTEQSVNLFFKFWIAAGLWEFVVAPAIDRGYLSYQDSLPITMIFTVSSLVQGYFWRRVFNKFDLTGHIHKWVTQWIQGV